MDDKMVEVEYQAALDLAGAVRSWLRYPTQWAVALSEVLEPG